MARKVTCTAFVLMSVALFICFATTPVKAQAVFGSIIGTVTDPQGAAVPNAKITVTDVRKGTSDTATTNDQGNYSVTHLIPDIYDISVTAQGFKTASSKSVTVSADTSARVDLALSLGSTSEAVEVTAEAPQLKTDRADVATTFNERYVTELPILNRNFTQFELLSPGTQKLGWTHAATENPQASQQIMVNGQHFSGTAYELDGTDNQDPILGIIVVNPNIDAITETKINLQNYDAEFGKAVAGVVTVQTKSGSNDFHGTGFWFRRTDATSARDPFTQSRPDPITNRFIPKDRWNQFGGTIGGPVIKNKLFFFGDYQGTRQASGNTVQTTVPSATVLSTCTAASGFCQLTAYSSLIGGAGVPVNDPRSLIYNPATGNPDGTGRTPFCGPAGVLNGVCANPLQANWIPVGSLDKAAVNILKLFPSPNTTDLQKNLIGSGSGPFSANQWDARGDWVASNSMTVFGRFSMAKFDISGTGLFGAVGGPGNGLGGLAGSSITHNYSLASGFTKTLSNTLLTDFRFGWFRYNPQTHKQFEGTTPSKNVGIPNVNNDAVTSGWSSFSYPNGGIMGGENIGNFGEGLNVGRCNCPLTESEQQFQFVNNWTKIHGNHTFKFGADIRYAENTRIPSDSNRAGLFIFDKTTTSLAGTGGFELASFLLGDVREFKRFVSVGAVDASERQKRLFFYGQDTWRVTPKLTLSYGLRWEIYTPESVNGANNGGFATIEQGEIRVAGVGNIGLNGNINSNYKAFAPRLGVAYQVAPKTVVRLGYGRSYDIGVFGSNFGHAVTQNIPVLVLQDLNAAGGFSQYFPVFGLSTGPPALTPVVVPSTGILPLSAGGGQPRIRPDRQRLPSVDGWNLTVQHQLTNTMSLEVGYVGSKGTHVFAGNGPAYDVNQIAYSPGTAIVTTAGKAPSFTAAGGLTQDQRRPFFNKFSVGGVLCCGAGTMGNYFGNDASNNYNSLQVKFDKKFSQGLQFQSSYTWAKGFNYSSDFGNYSVAPRTTYGVDDYNRDHVFIFNATYELPFGKGKQFASGVGRAGNLVIGGWQLTTTANISSGLPYSAFASNCSGTTDTGPCQPTYSGSGFANGTGDLVTPATGSPFIQYFTPVPALQYSAASLTVGTDTCKLARPTSGPFTMAGCGSIGGVGRNTFRGPGGWKDDLTVSKSFGLTERFNLQFRMDALNVFNHPVYGFSTFQGGGGTCVDCGGSNGQIQDIEFGTTMRQLQFGLKLSF